MTLAFVDIEYYILLADFTPIIPNPDDITIDVAKASTARAFVRGILSSWTNLK